MLETITLTEVTDVITPEEETTPKNYNFAMESTWEETTYSQGGGGDTPEGSIDISENGTYDVTDYAEAVVDVSNSYSASDEGKVVSNGALVAQTSDTVTTNDTYDTTLINSLTVNVQSGGGGVHTEEGHVELTDTNVGNFPGISIPVNLTSATGFVLNLYAVKTGEVSGGVVTEYSNVEIPVAFSGNSALFVYNYFLKYPQNPAPVIYRDSSNTISATGANNAEYRYAYRGNNGNTVGLIASPTITSQGITVSTGNGTRFFCKEGAYVKFKYEITWW